MKFEFKNIGIVKSADIELNGLTVITGLNDTGKSSISKSIYSIIKTLSEADNYINRKNYQTTSNLLDSINISHRQLVPFTQEKNAKFNTDLINQKLLNSLIAKQTPAVEIVPEIREYSLRVKEDLETIKNSVSDPNIIKRFDLALNNIHNYTETIIHTLQNKPTDELKYKIYFDEQVIQRIYQSQLNPLSTEKELEIKITDGVSSILQINVENNSTKAFRVDNELYLKNATLIDTPMVIQLADFIVNTMAFYQVGNRGDLTPYYSDLVQKWRVPAPGSNVNYKEIYDKVKKIISGEVKNGDNGIGIVFFKDNVKTPIRANNIASGIKSFGIIQLLINHGAINKNSLLIIDEPEVHLHPEWETQYAEIIVMLSKLGIRIIISTHSSYILESILVHSKLHNTESITNFYFGEKTETGSVFHPMTDNLDPIFKTLATPLQRLSEKG